MSKRSDHEAARRIQVEEWEQTQFTGGHHKFAMTDFLKWCQFPEFRVLFRAFETFPWARVGKLKDARKAEHIQSIAQHQVRLKVANLYSPLADQNTANTLRRYLSGSNGCKHPTICCAL